MKKSFLKKLLCCIAVGAILIVFGLCAVASTEDPGDEENNPSESGVVEVNKNTNNLGNYNVEIKSCRIAEDYEGKPIAIVTYSFTNNDDDAASFIFTFEYKAYQNGIGLNECYFADDSANYSSDNQLKEIKKGATLDVEVAYVLNDTVTNIEIEVSELISWDDDVVTKIFKLK